MGATATNASLIADSNDRPRGFNAMTDLRDGVHSNKGSEQKMVRVWFKPTEATLVKFPTSKGG
jgi:hypothetical protein